MFIDEKCFKCTIPVEYCTGKKIDCWEHYQRKLQAKTNREFKATVKKVHPPVNLTSQKITRSGVKTATTD